MTRVLILDDLQLRHDGFRKILPQHQLFHGSTVSQAQIHFTRQAELDQPIDLCCLDFDLDEGVPGIEPQVLDYHHFLTTGEQKFLTPDHYHDPSGERRFLNGARFAEWLIKQPNPPKKYVIHSHNPVGVQAIGDTLRAGIAGVHLLIKRFSVD